MIHSVRTPPCLPTPQRPTCPQSLPGDPVLLETQPLTDLLNQTGLTIILMMRTPRKTKIPTILTAPYGMNMAVSELGLKTPDQSVVSRVRNWESVWSFSRSESVSIKILVKLYSSLDLNRKITKIYLLRNQCFLPWLEISQLIWIMHRNQRFNLITFSKLSLCHKSRNYYVSNQLNPICFRLNLKCTFEQFEYSIQFYFIFIKSHKVPNLSIPKSMKFKTTFL